MNVAKDHPAILYQRMNKRLDFVIDGTEKLTKHFDQSGMDDHIRTFCILVLDRLNFASEGIKALMPSFLQNTKLEYTIGIIIRSIILDNLILMNAVKIVSEANVNTDNLDTYNKLNQFCLEHLSDGLNKTFNYIDKVKGELDSQKISNIYSNFYNANQHYFEPYSHDGTRPILKSKANSVASKLHANLKETTNLSKAASIYEIYVYYSQYDHFGSVFYIFSRFPIEDKIRMMDNAIRSFPKSLLFANVILQSINSKDTFLTERLNATTQFIDEINKG